MHIPDFLFGYSSVGVPVGIIFWIIALVFIALSIKWARNNLDESKIPILAVIAAGIFALQAFNLPTGFGVSGHLVGGALAAIVLGSPFAAVFILTIVLVIQALVFGDGGVLALGANIINMGVIAGFVGFYSFKALKERVGVPASAAVAGWLACVIAACACAVEIAILGAVPLAVGLPTMFIYHAIIGVIEAAITAIVVVLIFNVRPELAGNTEKKAMPINKFLAIGLVIALVIGGAAVFFASGDPDGLDSTLLVGGGAKDIFAPAHGEIEEADDPIGWVSPMPDYVLGGEDSGALGGLIALVIGIAAALIIILVAARIVYKKSET
ncbi:cobalt transporter CbiM [Methanorbis rubei]|uniref:Cobalt transport protein CbiM n=1 Tax=Methanorbis rubei TaxID=3028300 RepID=A0AAE4MG56_9EURY|nr:Cobalt transport protein CbiM [Methanocorpusculaceae archaeon Cs1]